MRALVIKGVISLLSELFC